MTTDKARGMRKVLRAVRRISVRQYKPGTKVVSFDPVNDPTKYSQALRQAANRLTEPAKKLAPQIDEILESLWRVGLGTCQLTGSGSACFAIASSSVEVRRQAARLRAMLEPGAIVVTTHSTHVPARVNTTSPIEERSMATWPSSVASFNARWMMLSMRMDSSRSRRLEARQRRRRGHRSATG